MSCITFGKDNMPAIQVKNEFCTGIISPFGAHVLSYIPANGEEVMMISALSGTDPNPIRGGVPICWPWFGKIRLPGHGLARLKVWELADARIEADGSDTLVFRLHLKEDDWDIKAEFLVRFGATLAMELTTINDTDKAIEYSEALHTYFKVGDSSSITVKGLKGFPYLDTVGGKNTPNCINKEDLKIAAEVDFVYQNPNTVEIVDPSMNRTLLVEKRGSNTTVVWNPWIDKSIAMPDYGNEEYKEMVCVEAANAKENARTLLPGQRHTLGQYITVLPL